jgi:hypothetical protein
MSDTPRTDAAIRNSGGQWSYALRETCEQLERELSEALYHRAQVDVLIAERDALAEALERLEKTAGQPALWDDPVRHNARKALAAVKGGSHE